MLVHNVMYKLREGVDADEIVALFRSLEGNVPTLLDIEVGANVIESDRAHDVAIICRFADEQALRDYQVHPFHQQIATKVRTNVERSASVDFLV